MVKVEKKINDVLYSYETGKFALRADSAVFARAGDTSILVTITVDKHKTDSDFFPLTVEFVEKMYSTGKISSNRFVKRERFPSDQAILKARAIDRSIRPYFPKNFKNPVQVIVTLFSYDFINDPLSLAINTVGVALEISSVPFNGPVVAVRVGEIDNLKVIQPNIKLLKDSTFDLLFAGRKEEVSMIEFEGKVTPDNVVIESFDTAIDGFKVMQSLQEEFISKVNKKNKIVFDDSNKSDEIIEKLGINIDLFQKQLNEALYTHDDEVYSEKIKAIKDKILEDNSKLESPYSEALIEEIIYKYSRKIARDGVLNENKRLSGRKMDEIREIYIEKDLIPVVHGSGFFQRGITQALSIVTLASMAEPEMSESFLGEETRYYIHHYNGPSYSLGEASRFSYNPGRREIGHGELAEKALKAVLPDQKTFPYTIRVVSEVLSQSGSSSMASTCGSTIALMDAGVPIIAPVAGIAIGLVTTDDFEMGKGKYQLVVDMADKEDFFGDMDFKATGTTNGITALQMDNKIGGVNIQLLKEALQISRTSLNFILDKISDVISKPNTNIKSTAPQVKQIKINTDKIGELIGPGGKNIKSIIEKTGSKIDISDDGLVSVMSESLDTLDLTLKIINDQVGEPEIGSIVDGIIDGVEKYGIFVNIGNKTGLVHYSELPLNPEESRHIYDFYHKGESIKVMILGVENGKIKLSVKQVNK